MARSKSETLNDSMNVPMPRAFKRRLIALAERAPGEPAPTKYARMLLQRAVEQEEREGVVDPSAENAQTVATA